MTAPPRGLEILIDGQPGKIYGSQGQQRSAVLSMKLAEASVAGEVLGEHPVMLLDDVLSELDDARQTYLLTRIEDKQTFVTTAIPPPLPEPTASWSLWTTEPCGS